MAQTDPSLVFAFRHDRDVLTELHTPFQGELRSRLLFLALCLRIPCLVGNLGTVFGRAGRLGGGWNVILCQRWCSTDQEQGEEERAHNHLGVNL